MKLSESRGHLSQKSVAILARAFIVAGFLLCAMNGSAQTPPGVGTNSSPTYTQLDSWSFRDHTNWTSDKGYAPAAFTNLDFSQLGNGSSQWHDERDVCD